MAMGHYRLSAPFMALALPFCNGHHAVGRFSARKTRQACPNSGFNRRCGSDLAILARSATVGTPVLWPLMYLVVLIPVGVGIFMLWRPFWVQDVYVGLTAQWQQRRRPEGQI